MHLKELNIIIIIYYVQQITVRLHGPGSSRVLDGLLCFLSLILKHSDTKWDTKKNSQANFGGGGAHVYCTPASRLDPPLIHGPQYEVHCISGTIITG